MTIEHPDFRRSLLPTVQTCAGPERIESTVPQGRRVRRSDHGFGMIYLVVTRGPSRGLTMELRAGSLVVGRGRAAGLRIGDPAVSRAHIRIDRDVTQRKLRLCDLQTTNQTYVNQLPVSNAELQDGDLIELGDSALRVTFESPGSEQNESALAALASLSARQLEVARLAAAGLNNGEIGRRLHISPRTVGNHLRNIYQMLSIGSRVQLATAIANAGYPVARPNDAPTPPQAR